MVVGIWHSYRSLLCQRVPQVGACRSGLRKFVCMCLFEGYHNETMISWHMCISPEYWTGLPVELGPSGFSEARTQPRPTILQAFRALRFPQYTNAVDFTSSCDYFTPLLEPGGELPVQSPKRDIRLPPQLPEPRTSPTHQQTRITREDGQSS